MKRSRFRWKFRNYDQGRRQLAKGIDVLRFYVKDEMTGRKKTIGRCNSFCYGVLPVTQEEIDELPGRAPGGTGNKTGCGPNGRCRCICRGYNHGKGYRKAARNSRTIAEKLAKLETADRGEHVFYEIVNEHEAMQKYQLRVRALALTA